MVKKIGRFEKARIAAWRSFLLTLKGLVTYYVLFFIQLESRRVCVAGITYHPDQQWMDQMGRNVTMQKWGFLANSRYLLHDRDSKFCPSFRQLIEAGRVKTMPLPARSPNLNAYAERWVRIGETGMPVEAHLVWGEAAAPSPAAIRGPLPRGASITRASRTGSSSHCQIEGRAGITE